MSYLLGLDVPDYQAMTDLRIHLEVQASSPRNLAALKTAKALERFFAEHGEHIIFGPINQPSEPGFIRTGFDFVPDGSQLAVDNTPIGAPLPTHEEIEQTEAIVGEHMYVPPSPEDIVADQAHRVTEITIQYDVGDLTKMVSYKLAVDMSNVRPTGPHISVNTGDIDPKIIQERIAKSTQHHKTAHGEYDYTTRGIGVKKAMEIADNPSIHNRPTLEVALRVLRDHILTQPYSSDIARK